jgi:hypothetical protein
MLETLETALASGLKTISPDDGRFHSPPAAILPAQATPETALKPLSSAG